LNISGVAQSREAGLRSCSGAASLEPSMLAYPAAWWGHGSICLSVLASYSSTLSSIWPSASKDNYGLLVLIKDSKNPSNCLNGTAQSCFRWLKFIFLKNKILACTCA